MGEIRAPLRKRIPDLEKLMSGPVLVTIEPAKHCTYATRTLTPDMHALPGNADSEGL